MDEKEKKYCGYGYHGGGRKRLPDEQKAPKKYKTVSISAFPEQAEELKAKAEAAGISVSKYVIEKCL